MMVLSDIARARMVNQQIVAGHFHHPAEIVAWLGAVQAQEYSLSKWALGLRLPGCIEADVETAITNGEILRTHLLRPTWHFVAPADIRWLLTLTAPRVHAINAFMYRKMQLDNKLLNKCNDIIAGALRGGKQLTRAAVQLALDGKNIKADGTRLSCIMMHAELDAIICSGAREGNQFTYALLEERVPQIKKMGIDESLEALTTRYFTSRGPASLKDFSVWSGLTNAQVKKGMEIVSAHFTAETIGGELYYQSNTVLPSKKQFQHAWLLAPYDEYIMGYKNRDAIFFKRNKMSSQPKMRFDNTIVIDGQVVGSWRRTIQKNAIDIEYHLFTPTHTKNLSLFKQAIKKYSKFMGLPVVLIKNSQ